MSNFLGDVNIPQERTSIISANLLMSREGANLQKSLNYREGSSMLSAILVLQRGTTFGDSWDLKTNTYSFVGHDSTTVESGKVKDQLMTYESGRLTENGKFYKAAKAYADEIRERPLSVQIYEKLDPGVWYDKGVFELIDAEYVDEGTGKIFRFFLIPDGSPKRTNDIDWKERMMTAGVKASVWERDKGRCVQCKVDEELTFIEEDGVISLRCPLHGGRRPRGLLG